MHPRLEVFEGWLREDAAILAYLSGGNPGLGSHNKNAPSCSFPFLKIRFPLQAWNCKIFGIQQHQECSGTALFRHSVS